MIKKYNQYIKESAADKFISDGYDSIIYYTKDRSESEILNVYKILFANGFSKGNITNINDLSIEDYTSTFLLVNLRTNKIIYSNNNDVSCDHYEINRYLLRVGLRKYFYLFDNFKEFKYYFSVINIKDYFKPNELTYESLLDKMVGPSKEDIDEHNSKNPNGYLINSVVKGSIMNVRKALRYGANIDCRGDLLDYAVQSGSIKVVKELIEHGVKINLEKMEPLVSAIKTCRLDIFKLLVDNGYDFTKRIKHYNYYKHMTEYVTSYELAKEYGAIFIMKYIKSKESTNESLLDKMVGPSFSDIEELYKTHQINILKYKEYCKVFNEKEPSDEEVLDYISSLEKESALNALVKFEYNEELKKLLDDYYFSKSSLEDVIQIPDIKSESLQILIEYILKEFVNFNFEYVFNVLIFDDCLLENIKYLLLNKKGKNITYNKSNYIEYMFKNACNMGSEKYLDFIKFLIDNGTEIYKELIVSGIEIANKKNNTEIVNYLKKLIGE